MALYRPAAHPPRVALFVSGDGGWNQGVVSMARQIAATGALVAGVDIRRYLRALDASSDRCAYPASDFEALGQYLEKRLDFPDYTAPVLIGYSSGATLVYAALVQAPSTTFRGAISMGFCPDLPVRKPFCRGNGLEWDPVSKPRGVKFRPAGALAAPWIAFQGAIDQVCSAEAVRAFVDRTHGAELVLLPRVGHGFSVERNWLPQFRAAFARLAGSSRAEGATGESASAGESAGAAGGLSGLPLTELRAAGPPRDALVVWITGDGGYGVTDKGVTERLAGAGYPVVVWNSLHYFWKPRTPETAAADLSRLLAHYARAWNRGRFVLVGYSLGADVLPFLANRLPPEQLDRVSTLVLLGPSHEAHFEFHVTDWLGSFKRKSDRPVLPEIQKLTRKPILCFYGEDEKDTIGPELAAGPARVIPLPGGHRIGTHYDAVADSILAALR